MILDILKKVDVAIYASQNLRKSLFFKIIFIMKIKAIVLIILLIIALIKDLINKKLILFLNCLIFNNILILYNIKKINIII